MVFPIVWHDLETVGDFSPMLSPRDLKVNAYEAYAKSIPQDVEDLSFITKATLNLATKRVTCDNDPYTAVLEGCTAIDVAYDQLNRFNIAWLAAGDLNLYWFDAVVSSFVTTNFGAAQDMCFLMDDVRHYSQASSTMILFYTRDSTLYYRAQIDRFSVEYVVEELSPQSKLSNVGLNNLLRLQVIISGVEFSELADYVVMVDSSYVLRDNYYLGVKTYG